MVQLLRKENELNLGKFNVHMLNDSGFHLSVCTPEKSALQLHIGRPGVSYMPSVGG